MKPVSEMTKQEVFDIVAEHLLTQNERAYDQHLGCMYRSPQGLKCAVGVLIPDEQYDPKMECGGIYTLNRNFPQLGFKVHEDLLKHLQEVHDGNESTEHWRSRLRNIALSQKLEWKFAGVEPK